MFGGKRKKAENLMQSGVKGVGTIVGVKDTGMTINDNPRVVVSFRIDPLDGTPAFAADKKVTVSRVAIPQAGQRYPVWFDAADHSSFMYAQVDNDEGRQQIVSMFGDAFGADGSGIGQAASVAPAPAPPAAPAAADPIDQLSRLDQLRQSGALSEEEFAVQKQRILGL
jgi:hypothetical protein